MACLVMAVLSATNPGMKVVLSDDGINSIKDTLLPYVYDLVGHMMLGDINGTQNVPVVGPISYSVTEIHFPQVLIGKSKVYFDDAGQAMDASASEIALQVAFRWEYSQQDWPHAHDSGTGIAVDKDGMATIVLSVGYNQTTRIPEIHTSSLTLGLGKLSLKLESQSGSVVSWFEDLFADVIILLLKGSIEKAAAMSAPAMLDAALHNTLVVQPFQQEVMPGIGLDYSFPAKSVVTQHDIALPIAGEFYPYNQQPGTTPGEPSQLPDGSTTNEMIEVYLSEWSLNALGRAAFYGGRLTKTITSDVAPPELSDYFVSSYYASMAPGLIDVFGNDAEMAFVVNVEDEPKVTVALYGFDVDVVTRVTLLGKKKDDPAFTKAIVVDSHFQIDGLISTDGDRIVGNLTAATRFDTCLIESTVGTVDMRYYANVIEDLVEAATSHANAVLAQGFPLPSLRGLSIKKPIIVWSASHYVLLSGDLQYIPPE